MTLEMYTEEEQDQALGTVSAQKIFRLLASWGTLSLKELQEKSQISESQLHLILQRLVKVKIVSKEARGIYILHSSPFVTRLKEAYLEQIKQSVNFQIYQIQNLLKQNQQKEADQRFQNLQNRYQPVLQKYFSAQLSGLVHQVLEKYEI